MDKPTYRLQSSADGLQYVFERVSDEKRIIKAVAYIQSEDNSDLYQLIFGDLAENGEIDVLSVSNNADMKVVLTTVVSTFLQFFNYIQLRQWHLRVVHQVEQGFIVQ